MFARATDGTIVNLDQYHKVDIHPTESWQSPGAKFEAVIIAVKHMGAEFEGYTESEQRLWFGKTVEANDKMAELWNAIQSSEWTFDFQADGTAEEVSYEEPSAHQPLDDDFGF